VRNLRDRLLGRGTIEAQVSQAASDGFPALGKNGLPLPKDWIHFDDLSDAQKKLLGRLPSLTPAERARLTRLVKAAPAKSPAGGRLKQFLLLGLYDSDSWTKLAGNFEKFPVGNEMAANYLPLMAKGMPESLRHDLLGAVGAQYEGFAKSDLAHGLHKNKRTADLYLKELLPGDKIILGEIKQGKSPREALAAYFSQVQSYVKGGRLYSADDTIEILKHVQKAVRHKAMHGGRGKGGAEPVIFVGGGLPNGRATLAYSDLDVGGNFPFSHVDRREIERYLESYVKKVSPETGFHLSMRASSPDHWEKLFPVAFKVRAGSIDMLVYDAKGEYRSLKIE
jgi:hypothetical protein